MFCILIDFTLGTQAASRRRRAAAPPPPPRPPLFPLFRGRRRRRRKIFEIRDQSFVRPSSKKRTMSDRLTECGAITVLTADRRFHFHSDRQISIKNCRTEG